VEISFRCFHLILSRGVALTEKVLGLSGIQFLVQINGHEYEAPPPLRGIFIFLNAELNVKQLMKCRYLKGLTLQFQRGQKSNKLQLIYVLQYCF
jgi:hypothetical protein